MTWEYRVVKRTFGLSGGEKEDRYAIHEYYTPADWNGQQGLITEDAMEPEGETLDELREDLEHMMTALDKPVLRWEDFNEGEKQGE